MTWNLLRETPGSVELESSLRTAFRGAPLPVWDAPAWREAAARPFARRLFAPVRARALAELGEPLPVLTDELYADFRKTGVRLNFERVYFERRRRLARAAIAVLLGGPEDPERERLVASLTAAFEAVFAEVSWALPAHVHWHDDNASGKEPLQIDLFCAETANLMGEVIDLFGPLLPAPLIARVRERLRADVFENYLRTDFHWMEVTHNWNAVCHQGVLGAALSQWDDVPRLAEMLRRAAGALPRFLDGFSNDGGCSEGIGYWSYGFGWFSILNQQLEARTAGALSLFEGDAKVRAIARFGPMMALADGKLVNFADNGAEGGLPPALLSYLGRRLGEAGLPPAEAEAWRTLARRGIDLAAERCDLFCLGRLLLACPAEVPEPVTAAREDGWLPDLAVLVAHGTDRQGRVWDFAAKAGHNGEHHNHNDCGSFLLNVDGIRLLVEIGSPEYVKAFFSPERYTFLAARTLGHSLPLINGAEQVAGGEHAARVLSRESSPTHAAFSLDATACYPAASGCRRFVRSFHFDKEAGRLSLHDAFTLDRADALESGLIISRPVIVKDGEARIEAGAFTLAVRPLAGTRIDRVEVHPYRTHDGEDATVSRLVLVPETLAAEVGLGVVFESA